METVQEVEKLEQGGKTVKACVNLLPPTWSQRRWQRHKFILELPEAPFYRKDLEPLLGAVVILKANKFQLLHDEVEGEECYRILLKDAEVIKCPQSRNVQLPIVIHHIWTIVDADWVNRNDVENFQCIRCKGFLYVYGHQDHKNIGIQALTVKEYKEKEVTEDAEPVRDRA